MKIFKTIKAKFTREGHHPRQGGLEIFKYIGPGLLVTVGFIDPGNWASNLAAGADYGYALLWMVTLSTIMLIVLQHNVAHLGIATGLCLSEATTAYLPAKASKAILGSAMLASISTSLAEILGGAIALQMLFGVPMRIGSLLVLIFVLIMLFTNSYRLIVHLRTVAGNDRLAGCRIRMGHPVFPRRIDGHHHERTGRRRNAAQPLPALGNHPEPPVEPERREND